MWRRKWRAEKGRQKRKAAQMVQLILFIISLHPKKITEEQIHLSLPQKHEIGPSDLFFDVFLILSGTKPLTSTMCLYCLFAMDLFRCSPGEWKPIDGSGVPSPKSSGKKITSFRAAKNPLLWRHNDLKFNLFRVHLYENSTMIHLK